MDYNKENINKQPEDVAVQIGPQKGRRIGDVPTDELQRLYDNLHGLKEKNPTSFSPYEVFHDKLEEFLGSDNKESEPKTEIEQRLPDHAFIIPRNLNTKSSYAGEDIRNVFKVDESHLHWLLNNILNYNRSDATKNSGGFNFAETLKTYLQQKESIGSDEFEDKNYPTDTIPITKLEGQKIADVAPEKLVGVHGIVYSKMINDPETSKKYMPFFENLTKTLTDKGMLMKIGNEYLYPKDIEFYNKYSGSEYIGSEGQSFNNVLKVIDSSGTKGIAYKKNKQSKVLWFVKFVVVDSNDIVTYYETNLQNIKSSVIMDLVGNVGKFYRISGVIQDTGVRKGVKETVIQNVDIVKEYGSGDFLAPNSKKKEVGKPNKKFQDFAKKELSKKYDVKPAEGVASKKMDLSEHIAKIMHKTNYIIPK